MWARSRQRNVRFTARRRAYVGAGVLEAEGVALGVPAKSSISCEMGAATAHALRE